MMHFVDEIDTALQARMAKYLRAVQRLDGHGAWDLYFGGDLDMSCSVKAYFALKAAGDSPDAPHMSARAKSSCARRRGEVERVHAHPAGHLRRGAVARHAVHAGGIRAVSALGADPHGQGGLLGAHDHGAAAGAVLDTRAAKNPLGVHVQELFVTPPELEREYFPRKRGLPSLFLKLDRVVRHPNR
jgi:squalene-hopene/tetraprenyl-beta-curcumene cyclase